MTQALQIISTGTSDEECSFILIEENLNQIIDKIPPNMKVAIVAVVGAFRTGKSFLLNLFLRFLRNASAEDLSQKWLITEGDELHEGNMNEGGWSIVENSEAPSTSEAATSNVPPMLTKDKSFAWRGGQTRQTTGIWMWSEPFIVTPKAANGDKIAVLLMDTQGMFDNETTMTLTAQIFGLSTLVSSFQIYNVDKRIQEDNLQHLALFSEYGRMALQNEQQPSGKAAEEILAKTPVQVALEASTAAAAASEEPPAMPPAPPAEGIALPASAPDALPTPPPAKLSKTKSVSLSKPFQRLQFLVRDWQNFDTEYNEGDGEAVFAKLHQEMQGYLDNVLKTRSASDLQSTRDQITRCFEVLDCFMLPHPGFAVTKKNYDGSIMKISEEFRALLNQYNRLIFHNELTPKVINGRAITGSELRTFFTVYVKMFQSGEKQFPKAMTMLEATAEANNRNAYDLALSSYKAAMEGLLYTGGGAYVPEKTIQDKHREFLAASLETFDDIATMGAESQITTTRTMLERTIDAEKKRFFEVNALKNPYKDMEYYILPAMIAVASYILAKLTDISCSSDFCEKLEDTFDNIYLFIFFVLAVIFYQQIAKVLRYIKDFFIPLIAGQLEKVKTN